MGTTANHVSDASVLQGPDVTIVDDALVKKTYDLLYNLWFPINQLAIPDRVRTDIVTISQGVQAGFWSALNVPLNPVLRVLTLMTYPSQLPFYASLKNSSNPAIKQFITVTGGLGALTDDQASAVLSFFFEGTAGPLSTEFAMLLREAFLSTIWDLPLAVPLTGIQQPETFVSNPVQYSKIHYPNLPASRLVYKDGQITHTGGSIEYLVIGSGPAGATVASELQKAGKRVVLIEQGPWVVWGSMNTMSYPRLMMNNDRFSTEDNSIILRSGQVMGGGTAVNIDLAFSPLESTIQSRIAYWVEQKWVDVRYFTQERIAAAYQWVRNAIATRAVTQSELNRDNKALWDGANRYGVDPSLYHLNRFDQLLSPSPVTQKRDAALQLILPAAEDVNNPLSVIPDVSVQEVLLTNPGPDGAVQAVGATLIAQAPWNDTNYQNTIIDPCNLQLPQKTQILIKADNVILCAGTIGSTKVLQQSAAQNPAVNNPRIGKGIILHPSFPLIGVFDERVNLLEGLDSATYLEAFGVTPGFIFETMGGLPAYGALLIPGTGKQVYDKIIQFSHSVGFGVMLVDTPNDNNCVVFNNGQPVVRYVLSDSDKKRFANGVAIAIRMMFLAGAKEVIIPTNENVLGVANFDPMVGVYLTDIKQADVVKKNLQFIPNRTLLTSAHLQATNKMGNAPNTSVASTNQRIWNVLNNNEVPNFYLMDSSMFPTSVGANPMQSLYTFAKIFSERLLNGMNDEPPAYSFSDVVTDEAVQGPGRG